MDGREVQNLKAPQGHSCQDTKLKREPQYVNYPYGKLCFCGGNIPGFLAGLLEWKFL